MAQALGLHLCHVAGARPHLVTSTRHHGGPLLHARCGSAAKGQLRVAHVEAKIPIDWKRKVAVVAVQLPRDSRLGPRSSGCS
ncbi:hypothetical protein EJB05_56209 [Eragrostis curvula]|uniref:Uncharacterized protein n=1 Tax=Eragrostis curvula TaxID=38414 RepID=A0A5J9SGW2_9POAL|nr:hypothetical protein EJB05_56209 [Eragrostis curvula]